MLLSVLRCTGHSHRTKDYPPRMPVAKGPGSCSQPGLQLRPRLGCFRSPDEGPVSGLNPQSSSCLCRIQRPTFGVLWLLLTLTTCRDGHLLPATISTGLGQVDTPQPHGRATPLSLPPSVPHTGAGQCSGLGRHPLLSLCSAGAQERSQPVRTTPSHHRTQGSAWPSTTPTSCPGCSFPGIRRSNSQEPWCGGETARGRKTAAHA